MTLTISRSIEISQKPPKLGRNDPCYCGSGKKYKKCHLLKEYVYSPEEKSHYISRVVDWVTVQPWFKDIFTREIKQLFGQGAQVEENEINVLMEATIFAMEIDGKTPLEHFVNQAPLSESDRDYYKRWVDESVFSAFEVKKITIGSSVEIQDFHDGRSYLVYEKLATYSLQEGMIAITRIIPFRDHWVFTGASLGIFPKEALYTIEREIGRHGMPRMPQLVYVRHELGEGRAKKNLQDLSFGEIKRRLKSEFEKKKIEIDIGELDQKIERKEDVYLDKLVRKIARKCTSEEELHTISDLLYEMHKKHPIFQKLNEEPGPREKQLISQMMHEAEMKFVGKYPAEKVNQILKPFSKIWLDARQEELGGRTPREVILDERKIRGNPHKEIAYQLKITPIPPAGLEKSGISEYDKAVKLMNEKKDYLISLEILSIINPDQLPEPFRWYNNMGICLISLGEMELAKKYFLQALNLNPSYDLPKINLKNYDDKDTVEQMKKRGRQTLFESIIKDNVSFYCKNIEDSEISKDAYVFLHYITRDTITLTPKRRFIPFGTVLTINSEFIHPDPTHATDSDEFPYREEWQMPKVNFLKIVLTMADVLKEDGYKLKVTRKGAKIINLTSEVLWQRLFTTWLVKIGWKHLGESPSDMGIWRGQFQNMFQDRTFELLETISKLNNQFSLSNVISRITIKKKGSTELSDFYELFLQKSFFYFLEWFGFIKTNRRQKILQAFSIVSSELKYEVTPLGQCVISEMQELMRKAIPVEIRNNFSNPKKFKKFSVGKQRRVWKKD